MSHAQHANTTVHFDTARVCTQPSSGFVRRVREGRVLPSLLSSFRPSTSRYVVSTATSPPSRWCLRTWSFSAPERLQEVFPDLAMTFYFVCGISVQAFPGEETTATGRYVHSDGLFWVFRLWCHLPLSGSVRRSIIRFLCRHAFPPQCATTERCWSVWFDVAHVHHHSRLSSSASLMLSITGTHKLVDHFDFLSRNSCGPCLRLRRWWSHCASSFTWFLTVCVVRSCRCVGRL